MQDEIARTVASRNASTAATIERTRPFASPTATLNAIQATGSPTASVTAPLAPTGSMPYQATTESNMTEPLSENVLHRTRHMRPVR